MSEHRLQILANLRCIGYEGFEVIVATATGYTLGSKLEAWLVSSEPDMYGVHQPFMKGPASTTYEQAMYGLLIASAQLVSERKIKTFNSFVTLSSGKARTLGNGAMVTKSWSGKQAYPPRPASAAASASASASAPSSSRVSVEDAIELPPTYETAMQ